jgi:hypothetical protein
VIDFQAREHYHALFSFLLLLKRVAYALREIWIFCKRRKQQTYQGEVFFGGYDWLIVVFVLL